MANQGNSNSSGSGKSNRGFASMDPVRQRQIASEGGRASRSNATSHRDSQGKQSPGSGSQTRGS